MSSAPDFVASAVRSADRACLLDVRDVAILSRAAWVREGSPPHRRTACRQEVLLQLRATRKLLLAEVPRPTAGE